MQSIKRWSVEVIAILRPRGNFWTISTSIPDAGANLARIDLAQFRRRCFSRLRLWKELWTKESPNAEGSQRKVVTSPLHAAHPDNTYIFP